MTDENSRSLPTSELDLNLMLTDSVWGRPEVSSDLKDKLTKLYLQYDGEGKKVVSQESMWGLLNFYTRDMRLANLSNDELEYCRHYLDLAGDCLTMNLIESFLTALSRVATVLETSQSKGGFLRKQMNTLTQNSFSQQLEPPKKGFFGMKKQEAGGY